MSSFSDTDSNRTYFFIFKRADLCFFFVIFLLGFLTGAAIITAYSGKDIDKLILENNELKSSLKEAEEKIEQLDQQYRDRLIIQTIKPYLDTDLNKHKQQEIVKKIQSLLSGLIGKKISEIDPFLLHDIINEASLVVEGHTYQLQLLYLVISYELNLYLKVYDIKDINKNKE
ncbi:MAG: hypothetical protein GX175_04685 [Halanaerobiaceae bacterium]|nr:hypothetical protein [Halanaerobiaceae bacterium]